MTTATPPATPADRTRAGRAPGPLTVTATVASPIGPLALAARGGRLVRLEMRGQAHARPRGDDWVEDPGALRGVSEQLEAYFAGDLTDFDVPIELEGTPFQRRVWEALLAIPYGETWSYGQLAEKVGNPRASRAVGLANGRNPIAVIVPCHRVIGADGGLTGYGGGLDRKVFLLEHERRVAGRAR